MGDDHPESLHPLRLLTESPITLHTFDSHSNEPLHFSTMCTIEDYFIARCKVEDEFVSATPPRNDIIPKGIGFYTV